jgi:hypothetical protein
MYARARYLLAPAFLFLLAASWYCAFDAAYAAPVNMTAAGCRRPTGERSIMLMRPRLPACILLAGTVLAAVHWRSLLYHSGRAGWRLLPRCNKQYDRRAYM